MRVAVFSTKPYDRRSLDRANQAHGHELVYFEARLLPETTMLARGFEAVCPFVNDRCDAEVLTDLAEHGLKVLALRSAGYNHVDLAAAEALGVAVARVPAYSPHAVAEHAMALILTLNRKIHRAYGRVRDGNFSLEGLLGFDLHGKTAGLVGTGRIGAVMAAILRGFGCRVLAYDPYPSEACRQLGCEYVPMDALLSQADIISLHLPLTPETFHLIGPEAVSRMKRGAMLINTSRGGLVDTKAVIAALKSGHLGSLGLDVYEEEADVFFEDLSGQAIQDDVLARLLTFPNVVITGHQGFFTAEALHNIAETTLGNLTCLERGESCPNLVKR